MEGCVGANEKASPPWPSTTLHFETHYVSAVQFIHRKLCVLLVHA